MNDKRQETRQDILTEMRKLAEFDEKSTDKIPRSLMGLGLRTYADRIEAADKRENVQIGCASAMREALDMIHDKVNSLDEECGVDPVEIRDLARAALAKPPRNCDMFETEPEAKSAFIAYYNEAFGLKGSKREIDIGDLKHDVDGILHDYIQWLFTSVKSETKGKPDGNK